MNPTRQYRRTVTVVCAALLIEFCLAVITPFCLRTVSGLQLGALTPYVSPILELMLVVLRFLLPLRIIGRFSAEPDAPRIRFAALLTEHPIRRIFAAIVLTVSFACLTEAGLMLLDRIGLHCRAVAADWPGSDPILWLLRFAIAVILPAFLEEMLFRGAVMSALMPYGRLFALFASSALFALMHADPHQLLYAFGVGVLLGCFAQESGSLWMPVLTHLVINTVAFLIWFGERAIPAELFLPIRTAAFLIALPIGVAGFTDLIRSVRAAPTDETRRFRWNVLIPQFLVPVFMIYFVLTVIRTVRWFYL